MSLSLDVAQLPAKIEPILDQLERVERIDLDRGVADDVQGIAEPAAITEATVGFGAHVTHPPPGREIPEPRRVEARYRGRRCELTSIYLPRPVNQADEDPLSLGAAVAPKPEGSEGGRDLEGLFDLAVRLSALDRGPEVVDVDLDPVEPGTRSLAIRLHRRALSQRPEVVDMPPHDLACLLARSEQVIGEVADRREHREAWCLPARQHLDQALVGQPLEHCVNGAH